jgi:hypothetical protein
MTLRAQFPAGYRRLANFSPRLIEAKRIFTRRAIHSPSWFCAEQSLAKQPPPMEAAEPCCDSRNHLQEWRKNIDPRAESAIMDIAGSSPLLRWFAPVQGDRSGC